MAKLSLLVLLSAVVLSAQTPKPKQPLKATFTGAWEFYDIDTTRTIVLITRDGKIELGKGVTAEQAIKSLIAKLAEKCTCEAAKGEPK